MNYQVKEIKRTDCEEYILGIHYAKRWPSISYAYGLYRDDTLVGIVSYGTPASPTLRTGVAGKDFQSDVLELNRLCLKDNLKNEASRLVGQSLKMLPKGKVIVSYADEAEGHVGFIYQATNFIYCGLSAKRSDWKIRGKEHLHNTTIGDEFRGQPNRSRLLREKYGDDFYSAPRPRKHRYVTFTGSKSYKRVALRALKYKIQPYPKGEQND